MTNEMLPRPAALQPIAKTLIPSHLDGQEGSNRSGGRSQIAATDDRSAVLAWLAMYADRPATLSSYRKEAERLLLWCVHQRGLAMSSLQHEDLLMYSRFLLDPQPADRWVMSVRQRASRDSVQWRPFASPLSPDSQRHALQIINAMFSWLVEAGYLAGNPLSLRRLQKRQGPKHTSRFLPYQHWNEVKATILAMPRQTQRQSSHAARCRWLFSLLYLGGLRVSEMTSATMGGFQCHRDHEGFDRWWLEVTGKGGKTRLVPVTGELIGELRAYRQSWSMSSLPNSSENIPLILPIIGKIKPMARSAIHEIVKGVMLETANRLESTGQAWMASQIAQASTHWLRHTAGTHMTDAGVDIKVARDNLGHATISTTNIYLHSEDNARHEATERLHKIKWSLQE